MSGNSPPSKRLRYDLTSTFDVLVGSASESQQQRFTLYTDLFIPRSDFLRAARSSQWLSDTEKPVDLTDEEPATFALYMHCVYFGIGALQDSSLEKLIEQDNETGENRDEEMVLDAFECSEAELQERADEDERDPSELEGSHERHIEDLYKLYLIADKLQDLATTNIVIDEIIRYRNSTVRIPSNQAVRLAYEATAHGNPIRRLSRDSYVYAATDLSASISLHASNLPADFCRDMAMESRRHKARDAKQTVGEAYTSFMIEDNCHDDKCHYHQHNDKCPRCVPKPQPKSTAAAENNADNSGN